MTITASLPPARAPAPSIGTRLANALALWSLVWGVAVGAAVWFAASHEVDELLDDTLRSSAELVAMLVAAAPDGGALRTAPFQPPGTSERFAWQVVGADGATGLHSSRAPAGGFDVAARPGFGDAKAWRVFGVALDGGRLLQVGQARAERAEARSEVAMWSVAAALAVGLLGHVWLRERFRRELEPIAALSERLAAWNLEPSHAAEVLGEPTRRELEPVHAALVTLARRLAARMADERSFSAHAAHALRTPLAGIDAQLAVALRDCPSPLRERLQRVREAAARLQTVVSALLGLFRTGSEPRRAAVDVAALVARLPAPALDVAVVPDTRLDGDADLLAAAILNLIDNAQRHGASHAWIEPLPDGGLRVRDDGPGVPDAQRARIQAALDAQAYDGATGLGLVLADRVARAHGGRLRLPPVDSGFAVDLLLQTSSR